MKEKGKQFTYMKLNSKWFYNHTLNHRKEKRPEETRKTGNKIAFQGFLLKSGSPKIKTFPDLPYNIFH